MAKIIEIMSYVREGLQKPPLDENELPTCTAARMKHSSKSIENEKSKADSSNNQMDAGVMSSSFLAAVIDEM